MRRLALLAFGVLAACTAPEPRVPVTPTVTPSCAEAWAGGAAQKVPRAACRKEWTVLVYMAADNEDMPPYAYWHLHGMEAAFENGQRSAASTPHADVVVQLDLDEPDGLRRIHVQPAPIPFREGLDMDDFRAFTPDDLHSPVVALLDEDTGEPAESLRRFLDWGVTTYPSERYLVVIWGHGLGWRPAGLPHDRYDPGLLRGGIAFDDNPGTVLDIPGLRRALAQVSQDRLGGRPFDVYAADACLMQSLEVTAELAGVTRYLVGSEQIEDWLGLPWRSFIPTVNGTAPPPPAPADCPAGDAACRAAASLPALQREAFLPGGLYAGASLDAAEGFTLSALDAGAIPRAMKPALHRLGAALEEYLREDPLRGIDLALLLDVPRTLAEPDPDGAPGDAGRSALAVPAGTPGFLGGARDIGVFLASLRTVIAAEAAEPTPAAARLLQTIADTQAALDEVLIAAAFGAEYNGPRWAGRLGVSVWLPHDAREYQDRLDFFEPARLYAPPPDAAEAPWPGWLDQVFPDDPGAISALRLEFLR